MAINEDTASRVFHRTTDGDTLLISYTMSYTEWAAGTGSNNDGVTVNVPKIGDYFEPWGTDYSYLRCVDIRNGWITPLEMRAVFTFSSDNRAKRMKRPDQVSSWELSFDPRTVQEIVTAGYFDTVDKKGKSWKEIWENQTNIPTDMSAEDVPDLYKETSAFSWTLKVYASKLFTSTIADAVGTVNLVSHWLNRVLQSTNPLIKYAEFEDGAEVWLLLSCPITMVGFNNWEYAFTFVLGADNKYESVTADHKNSWNVSYGLKHNLYRKTNFGNLLIDMNVAKIDPDILGAVR